jgi:septin 6/8/11
METLFNRSFDATPSDHWHDRVTLDARTFDLHEQNVRLKLTLIETRGYGDQLSKTNSHDEILAYIDEQYEQYLTHELALKRHTLQRDDTRVHVCLYFICPTGHSLKAIDLSTMKALNGKCNVIPIIAKGDTVGKSHMADFKRRIMHELADNSVHVYQFPVDDPDLNVGNLNATANVSSHI